MAGELEQFIQTKRTQGKTDQEIETNLVSTGWNQATVKTALAGQLSSVPPPPPLPVTQPTPGSAKPHLNASQVLLVVGIVLIIVAAIVIVQGSWGELSPLARFLIIALPNAALFGITAYSSKQTTLEHVRDGTSAAGLVLLPLSIGAFLYQFNIYHDVDALLMMVSALIALPVFLFFDLVLKRPGMAVLTIIDLLAAIIFFFMYYTIDELGWQLGWLAIGVILFTIARIAHHQNDIRHQRPYEITSAAIFAVAVPATIYGLLQQYVWENNYDINGQIVMSVIAGPVLLLVGQLYGKLFKPWTQTEHLAQRLLQLMSLFVAFGFVIFSGGFGDSDMFPILISLVLSGLYIVYALYVGVKQLFVGGIIGAFIILLIFLLGQAGVDSLVMLLILGFAAIGLSILLGRSKMAGRNFFSAEAAERFGVISDDAAESLWKRTPNRRNPFQVGCLILVGIWLLYMIVTFAFSSIYGPRGF